MYEQLTKPHWAARYVDIIFGHAHLGRSIMSYDD